MFDRSKGKLSHIKTVLLNTMKAVWYLPDHFHWMAPLPLIHRRWIFMLFIMVIFLLMFSIFTTSEKVIPLPQSRPTVPNSPFIVDGTQHSGSVLIHPLPSSQNATNDNEQHQRSNMQSSGENNNQNQWQSFQIQSGQTLSQLFRENNLPLEDALALAKIEGKDKPLTNLRAGNSLKIKRSNEGRILAVDIEMPGQKQAFFIRHSNGDFYRVQ